MYRFKGIIVNLDLSESDVPLIKWAGRMARLARSEQLVFVYAREAVEIPDALKRDYPWLMEPLRQTALERAKAAVESTLESGLDCERKVVVEERPTLTSILETSLSENADLIITGGDSKDRSLAVKLARKASCTVMLVPSEASGEARSAAIALDLSRFSDYTLDVGLAFARSDAGTELQAVNYFAMPYGYHRTHLPKEHFKTGLAEQCEQRVKDFLDKYDTQGIATRIRAEESGFPGESIVSLAENEGIDLVIIGCRGKDALSATLLGSNAESALRTSKKTVILAVKEKGTGRSFLENLLGLETASRS